MTGIPFVETHDELSSDEEIPTHDFDIDKDNEFDDEKEIQNNLFAKDKEISMKFMEKPTKTRSSEKEVKKLVDKQLQLEIAILRNQNQELKNDLKEMKNDTEIDLHPSVDARDQKIVELSKKIRGMSMSLDRERQLNVVMAEKLKNYQVNERIVLLKAKQDPNQVKTAEVCLTQLKTCKDQLRQKNRLLENSRMQNANLKKDLLVHQRILVQEVGEDIPINKILETHSNGSWKGRSEQISLLKDKVNELTVKLQNQQQHSRKTSAKSSTTPIPIQTMADIVTSEKNRESIRKIEKAKKLAMEKAIKELELIKKEFSDVKYKNEAILARNKTLEKQLREACEWKEKVASLLSKSERDDNLINLLQSQLTQMANQKKKNIIGDDPTDDQIIDNLKRICSQQAEKIISQSHEINTIKNSKTEDYDSKNRPHHNSLKLNLCPGGQNQMFEAVGLQTIMKGLTVELDKYKELVDMLNEKLDAAHKKILDQETEVIKRRQMKKYPNSSEYNEIDKLMFKYEITKDENENLKSTLTNLFQEKEEQIKLYKDIVGKLKEGFKRDLVKIIGMSDKESPKMEKNDVKSSLTLPSLA